MKNITLTHLSAILFTMALSVLFNACSKEEGPGGGGGMTITVEPQADGVIMTCDMGAECPGMIKTMIVGGGDIDGQRSFFISEDIDATHYRVDSRSYYGDQKKNQVLLSPNTEYWCMAEVRDNKHTYHSPKCTFTTDKLAEVKLDVLEMTAYWVTLRATSTKPVKVRSIATSRFPIMEAIENIEKNPHDVTHITDENEAMGNTFEVTISMLQFWADENFIVADFLDGYRHVYSEVVTWSRNAPVVFPDANFQKCVVERYGTDGKITRDQIEKIENLDLSNADISDLSGMEWFESIKSLDLSGNLMDTVNIEMKQRLLKVFKCNDCPNLKKAVVTIIDADSLLMNRNPMLTRAEFHTKVKFREGVSSSSIYNLFITDNNIEELIIDNDEEWRLGIGELHCENNRLKELNIYSASRVYCQNNQISSLTFSGTQLDISNNKLTYLKLNRYYWYITDMLHCQGNPELTEVIVEDEDFVKHITDLQMDPQTKFVWPQEE